MISFLVAIITFVICVKLMFQETWPPRKWNWATISSRQAMEWSHQFGTKLTPGKYASDVYDQHELGYCGICFIVAPLQVVHDKLKIQNQITKNTYLDLQKITNQYASLNRSMPGLIRNPTKSICFGGDPFEVLNMLKNKKLGLVFKNKLENLKEHPRDDIIDTTDEVFVDVQKIIQLKGTNDDIKWYILKHGPVLAKIASNIFLNLSILTLNK